MLVDIRVFFFFFSSRRRHTRCLSDWSSDVCSSDLSMMRDEFQDYYSRWYVPSNMTVMVVGDTDPAMVADVIARHFGGGLTVPRPTRSEERRVGKGWRWRWSRTNCTEKMCNT